MSTILSITFINGAGPKATSVSFLKDESGNQQWAWISNEIAARLRPGMRLEVEEVGFGRVQTTWTNLAGETKKLSTPKVQLFLGGTMRVLKPETTVTKPLTVSFDADLDDYAAAYDAKHASTAESARSNEEPF